MRSTMAVGAAVCALVALVACTPLMARADGPGPLRRFVVTVAANDGGAKRERLQYAERDARAVSDVLEQLGGVEHGDAERLVQPSPDELAAAFYATRERVLEARRGGVRTELVFYYSGHSDERGLLLGPERVAYAELRKLLDELPVDVRIAILDSCASGAFTRLKGGVRRAPFLVDTSTRVRGHAFLTSASADEAAQESDRIGGSFFTHYLVSGLRGAADTSGDRKITLTEAYRFAFDETLARTAQTQYGSQHPAYEMRLVGTGDLVITDLRATTAEIVLDKSVEGRLFAWDVRRALVVEVHKARGKRLVLALPPGAYRLELARDARFFSASVSTAAGQPRVISAQHFEEAAREATLARGFVEKFERRPFAASLIPPFATNPTPRARPVLNHLSLTLLYDDPDAIEGLALALIGSGARRYASGVQLALLFNLATELKGLQLAGAVNVVRAFGFGAQLAFGANYVGAAHDGIQAATVGNHAHTLRGAQLGMGLNLALERAQGLQLGSVNWARALQGAQGGFVNLAREVQGVQAGALNVAAGRVRGLQLGLVNYAEEADFSLALLGITRKGGVHAQLTVSDVAAPELSLRLDANYNYSFVSVGFSPYGPSARHTYSLGAGLGFKAQLYAPYLWLDIDVGAHVVQPMRGYRRGLPNTLYQLRALVRVALHRHLSFFLGPTLNALLQLDADEALAPGRWFVRHESERTRPYERLYFWPGFAAGVRL